MQLPCPSCGAPVAFANAASVQAVCGYCRSILVRRDGIVDRLGVMAELPEDISPLQIGTEGKWEGRPFVLVGRLKQGWREGMWNEWYCLWGDDGQAAGWLADANGALMFTQPQPDAAIPPRANLQVNRSVTDSGPLAGLVVNDMREIVCQGAEGELPFTAQPGRRSFAVDVSTVGKSERDGRFGTIEYADDEPPRLYLGRYAAFAELKLTRLRELEGWKP